MIRLLKILVEEKDKHSSGMDQPLNSQNQNVVITFRYSFFVKCTEEVKEMLSIYTDRIGNPSRSFTSSFILDMPFNPFEFQFLHL